MHVDFCAHLYVGPSVVPLFFYFQVPQLSQEAVANTKQDIEMVNIFSFINITLISILLHRLTSWPISPARLHTSRTGLI
jgi:hypothetical protein